MLVLVRSTRFADVKSGKISATRNSDGSVAIDPAELHRVYPAVLQHNGAGNGRSNDPQPLSATPGTGFEAREIELLRERIADQAATIADLRARLDGEVEQRRQLLAMLTDRRPGGGGGFGDSRSFARGFSDFCAGAGMRGRRIVREQKMLKREPPSPVARERRPAGVLHSGRRSAAEPIGSARPRCPDAPSRHPERFIRGASNLSRPPGRDRGEYDSSLT
jgi:hypothetical protein